MKRSAVTLIILLFTSLCVHSQNDLLGKWDASCVSEQVTESSIRNCSICPFELKDNTATIQGFQMQFGNDSLMIITNTNKITLSYKYNTSRRLLEFNYNKQDYKFKVLIQNEPKIQLLKDKNNNIVLLKQRN